MQCLKANQQQILDHKYYKLNKTNKFNIINILCVTEKPKRNDMKKCNFQKNLSLGLIISHLHILIIEGENN